MREIQEQLSGPQKEVIDVKVKYRYSMWCAGCSLTCHDPGGGVCYGMSCIPARLNSTLPSIASRVQQPAHHVRSMLPLCESRTATDSGTTQDQAEDEHSL